MAGKTAGNAPPNILIVGQAGRLQYEAVLFALSLGAVTPEGRVRLFVAEPQPGPLWQGDPRMGAEPRDILRDLGATIVPFECRHFGQAYPYGNKIEALFALPEDEPFIFFDTDTLITGDLSEIPFDFTRPTASMMREDTWPKIELYGPGYAQIWKSLYDRFGLDFDSSLDLGWPDEYWQRYLYFNAGFFFYQCPHRFGRRFRDYALTIRDDPPPELVCQSLDPWLDQVALPLVIHSFGGGRRMLPDGLLDGSHSCHYRAMPLFYVRENDSRIAFLEAIAAPNRVKKLLKEHEPFLRYIYQGRGAKVREMFDQDDLPRREQGIRNPLKRAGLWMR
ncbi:hypothetical protein [Salipiger mangrovisoli]|uniref:Uncharacterized protein n=1 Tax=Salipiger mangrovisoli TaxID=2865933 RepID=A0ABR9X697_9RHOB|nr:hypothetical protein [Salipiger mangrovisoli]MBE9639120.1 hypothetical protein [Salipiger mangrovisoli]